MITGGEKHRERSGCGHCLRHIHNMKKIFSIDFFINQDGSHGSVTVFLTMILLPMLLLMITLTDYAKITVAKNQVSDAGELAANAGLSYYDEYLKDMYGLFAVSKDTTELQENLENYFTATLEGAGVEDNSTFLKELKTIFSTAESTEDAYLSLIQLEKQSFSVEEINGANLTNASILNNQIMDYMQYRGPLVIAGGILEKINAFKDLKKETKASQDKIKYEKNLSDIEKLCKTAYEEINNYNHTLDVISQEQLSAKVGQINESYQEAVRYIFLVEKNEHAKPVQIAKTEPVTGMDLDTLYGKLKALLEEGDYARERSQLDSDKAQAEANAVGTAAYLYRYSKTVQAFNDSNIRSYGEALEKALEEKKQELTEEIEKSEKEIGKLEDEIADIDEKITKIIKALKKDSIKNETIPKNTDYYKSIETFEKNYKNWNDSKNIKKKKKELLDNAGTYYEEEKEKADEAEKESIEKEKKKVEDIIGDISDSKSLFSLFDERVYKKYVLLEDKKSQKNALQSELGSKTDAGNPYFQLLNTYQQNISNFLSGGENYTLANKLYPGENKVKDLIRQGNTARDLLKNDIKHVADACGKAREAVEKVVKKIEKLEDNRQTWQNDVNELSGESKTSMQSELDEEASMDKGQAEQCKNTLKTQEEALKALKETVSKIEFPRGKVETEAQTVDTAEISERCHLADAYFEEHVKVKKSVYHGKTPEKMTEDNDDFYKYLKELVGKSEENKDSEKKEAAEKLRKSLLDNSSDSGKTSEDSASTQSVKAADASLPSVLEGTGGEQETGKTSVDKDKSEDAMNSDSTLLNLLTRELDLKNSLNDLYLTEYVMNMFTYRTYALEEDGTAKKAEDLKTLSNYDYNTAGILHKAEAEYVLWGKDSAKANQDATYAAIFGVRFLMNSIYALTNRDINTTTRAAAIAIAGFTGFGVPIVKTVLDLGLALLESKSDMEDLIQGKPVAIYKNSDTWKYSIEGAANTVKNEVLETMAKKAAAMAIDKLEECAEDKLDEVTDDYINPYLEEMTSNAIAGILDTITKRIESKLSSISIGDFASDEEIRQSMETWTAEFKTNLGVQDTEPEKSNVSDYILYISYQKINTAEFKDAMAQKIIELRDKADQTVDEKIEEYTKKIENYVIHDLCKIEKDEETGRYTKVFGKDISSLISNATTKVKDEVKAIAAEKAADAKDKINQKISEYCNKLPAKKAGGGLSITKNTTNKSAAAALTMNYKEYLTMFLLLTGLTKSSYDAHLLRTSDLIQINVAKKKSDDGLTSSFQMAKCKTHFKVCAMASGGTVLGAKYYLQESDGMYGISYTGVEGY